MSSDSSGASPRRRMSPQRNNNSLTVSEYDHLYKTVTNALILSLFLFGTVEKMIRRRSLDGSPLQPLSSSAGDGGYDEQGSGGATQDLMHQPSRVTGQLEKDFPGTSTKREARGATRPLRMNMPGLPGLIEQCDSHHNSLNRLPWSPRSCPSHFQNSSNPRTCRCCSGKVRNESLHMSNLDLPYTAAQEERDGEMPLTLDSAGTHPYKSLFEFPDMDKYSVRHSLTSAEAYLSSMCRQNGGDADPHIKENGYKDNYSKQAEQAIKRGTSVHSVDDDKDGQCNTAVPGCHFWNICPHGEPPHETNKAIDLACCCSKQTLHPASSNNEHRYYLAEKQLHSSAPSYCSRGLHPEQGFAHLTKCEHAMKRAISTDKVMASFTRNEAGTGHELHGVRKFLHTKSAPAIAMRSSMLRSRTLNEVSSTSSNGEDDDLSNETHRPYSYSFSSTRHNGARRASKYSRDFHKDKRRRQLPSARYHPIETSSDTSSPTSHPFPQMRPQRSRPQRVTTNIHLFSPYPSDTSSHIRRTFSTPAVMSNGVASTNSSSRSRRSSLIDKRRFSASGLPNTRESSTLDSDDDTPRISDVLLTESKRILSDRKLLNSNNISSQTESEEKFRPVTTRCLSAPHSVECRRFTQKINNAETSVYSNEGFRGLVKRSKQPKVDVAAGSLKLKHNYTRSNPEYTQGRGSGTADVKDRKPRANNLPSSYLYSASLTSYPEKSKHSLMVDLSNGDARPASLRSDTGRRYEQATIKSEHAFHNASQQTVSSQAAFSSTGSPHTLQAKQMLQTATQPRSMIPIRRSVYRAEKEQIFKKEGSAGVLQYQPNTSLQNYSRQTTLQLNPEAPNLPHISNSKHPDRSNLGIQAKHSRSGLPPPWRENLPSTAESEAETTGQPQGLQNELLKAFERKEPIPNSSTISRNSIKIYDSPKARDVSLPDFSQLPGHQSAVEDEYIGTE